MLERVVVGGVGRVHSFLACRAPVCCTRSDWVACLKMRGAKTESAWLLFQRGLLVRGGEEKPSEGRVGGVTDRITSPGERGIHSP